MLKSTVHQRLTDLLIQKHEELNAIRLEASDGKSNDAKSSAGDKHEVGVAMVQLEQENLGNKYRSSKNNSRYCLESIPQKNT